MRPLAALGATLCLVGAACGGDDDPDPAEQAPRSEPATATEERRQPARGPRRTRRDCRYLAPPGRLPRRAVAVELTGISCAQGRRLAEAAVLGQPAGANLAIEVYGFRCTPSSRARGVNVVYTCSRGRQSARFDVRWVP